MRPRRRWRRSRAPRWNFHGQALRICAPVFTEGGGGRKASGKAATAFKSAAAEGFAVPGILLVCHEQCKHVVERSYRASQLSGVFSKVAPLSSPPFPARNKHGRVLGWSTRGSGGYLESLAVYRPPHGQIATDVPRLDEWQGLWRIHTFYRPPFYGRRLQKS